MDSEGNQVSNLFGYVVGVTTQSTVLREDEFNNINYFVLVNMNDSLIFYNVFYLYLIYLDYILSTRSLMINI